MSVLRDIAHGIGSEFDNKVNTYRDKRGRWYYRNTAGKAVYIARRSDAPSSRGVNVGKVARGAESALTGLFSHPKQMSQADKAKGQSALAAATPGLTAATRPRKKAK